MPDLSVIIPTYNRSQSLGITLDSLQHQSLCPARYEVIVVDDGSHEKRPPEQSPKFSFVYRYIRQSNMGSAGARNTGAKLAKGQYLVFIDDDMTLASDYLAALLEEHKAYPRIIAMGTLFLELPREASVFAQTYASEFAQKVDLNKGATVDFTSCTTNNLSVGRPEFLEIGLFRDVAGDGRTLWGDVDFGYRAKKIGFRFRMSGKAICYHRDYSAWNLETAMDRSYETGLTAAVLAMRTPDVIENLPMFSDKVPIQAQQDSLRLIARKLVRRTASSKSALSSYRRAIQFLESVSPGSRFLKVLYRLCIGSELLRGYAEGLASLPRPMRS